jgi:threonine dehydrogenase-like Zn-dependent dehydrogenase
LTARDTDLGENERFDLIAPRRLEVVHAQLGPLPRDWVRVRFAYCGLCGTDVSHYTGQRLRAGPVSMGHEWVATVEATGSDVSFFAPGDVVTSDLNFRCGACRPCTTGRSHLCRAGQVGLFSNRGFARRADIHASYLHKLRSVVAPHLALAEPLSCAMHAIERTTVSGGDRVLLLGAGGIGTCVAFAFASHPQPVILDIVDRLPTRSRRLAGLAGAATRALDAPDGDYDVVLDTSGSEDGLALACGHVAPGGRLTTVSHLPTGTAATFLLDALRTKDVTLVISYLNGDVDTMERSNRLLERQWSTAWDEVLDVRPLDELPYIIGAHLTSSANKVVIDVGRSGSHEAR